MGTITLATINCLETQDIILPGLANLLYQMETKDKQRTFFNSGLGDQQDGWLRRCQGGGLYTWPGDWEWCVIEEETQAKILKDAGGTYCEPLL